MDTSNQAREGFGKFEETVHELEQAAAEKADIAGGQARRIGLAELSEAVRNRPASLMLVACVAGFVLGRLVNSR